jgi:rod shape-determining protein MreD
MNKRILYFLCSIGLVMLTIVFKSVVFPMFFTNDYMPDVSLIAIIYFSINYGKNIGQIMGFSSGFVLDSLSGAPFGLNSLVRLIMGFLLGFFEGKIFFDKIILPCIMVTICTFAKFGFIYLISIIYPVEINIHIFSLRYLVELGMNIILTPIIFMGFNILGKKLYPSRDRV